jgi:exopolysaccharide biosynthesis polyprenyl glycosylphosphotransferase
VDHSANTGSSSAALPVVPPRPSLARALRLSDRRALLLLGDALATGVAALGALWLWTFTSGDVFGWSYFRAHAIWVVALVPAWLLLNLDLYSSRSVNSWNSLTRRLLANAGLALGLYLALFFLAPRDLLPRLVIVYFIGGALLLGAVWRWLYVRLVVSRYLQRRALVVGAGWAGEAIVSTLARFQPREYRVLGFIDDDPARHGQTLQGVPVLGGTAALVPAVRAHGATEVILAVMGELRGETFQALLECQAAGLPVLRMSSLYEDVTGRVPIEHLDADLMAHSFIEPADRGQAFQLTKRLVDLGSAAAGLAILAALLPFVAAAIWLESRGPVFYGQTRLGQAGRLFTLWKFRTMIPEAEADGRPRWAGPDDERVTRVGRWLRRYRLDEAPQFWNVLEGHLSLIGPRPERPEFIAELEREIPFYRARHLVKPGLTGWAQVNYGYSATVADAAVKLQWDLYYIKHRSAWLDLVILLRTIGVVLSGQGT